ncbi:hypothetical protein ACROYT_G002325 [Oculina patagonica]
MKKTAASCILVLLLSALLAEGHVQIPNNRPGGKKWIKRKLDQNEDGISEPVQNLVPGHNGKRVIQMLDQNGDGISKPIQNLWPGHNGKRVMQEQRDTEWRRNLCLYARELDCTRELQEK